MRIEEKLGDIKVDKIYRMGEMREDKVRRLSKNRYLFDEAFLIIHVSRPKENDLAWYAESKDEHWYLCGADTLEHLLDEIEKRLNPDFCRGSGVPV